MNKRWGIVGFMAACGALNYTDRAAFGVAAPLITNELSISAAQMGIILSAFSVGYAIFNFVGGPLPIATARTGCLALHWRSGPYSAPR